jgi:hypothetical protein
LLFNSNASLPLVLHKAVKIVHYFANLFCKVITEWMDGLRFSLSSGFSSVMFSISFSPNRDPPNHFGCCRWKPRKIHRQAKLKFLVHICQRRRSYHLRCLAEINVPRKQVDRVWSPYSISVNRRDSTDTYYHQETYQKDTPASSLFTVIHPHFI